MKRIKKFYLSQQCFKTLQNYTARAPYPGESIYYFFSNFCSGSVAKLRIFAKFRSIKEKNRSRKPLGRIFLNLSSDAIWVCLQHIQRTWSCKFFRLWNCTFTKKRLFLVFFQFFSPLLSVKNSRTSKTLIVCYSGRISDTRRNERFSTEAVL